MCIIDLLIFSADSDYGLALGEGLSAYKNNFLIQICSTESGLFEASGFDLLILDSDSPVVNEKFKDDKRVIWLTGCRPDVAKSIEEMRFVLYKYSGLVELSADILLYFSMYSGKKNLSWPYDGAKMIMFCGGKGGVGKTAAAFGTASALLRYYSKAVLYISLEEVESTLLYIEGRKEGFGLCEYLYYLFKPGGKKPDARAFMIRDKSGVEAFMPDKGRNRLRELTATELAVFLNGLAESGIYDYILLDMGESLSPEFKWLFKFCHKTVAVLSPEWEGNEREQRFLDCLRFVSEKEPVKLCNNLEGDSPEARIKELVKKII